MLSLGMGEGNMSLTCYELKMRCTIHIWAIMKAGALSLHMEVCFLSSTLLPSPEILVYVVSLHYLAAKLQYLLQEECRVQVFFLHIVQWGN